MELFGASKEWGAYIYRAASLHHTFTVRLPVAASDIAREARLPHVLWLNSVNFFRVAA